MDLKTFSLKNDIKINIMDSTIKEEDVINSLYNHRTLIKENYNQTTQSDKDNFFEDTEIKIPTNLPENVNIIIPNESIRNEDVLRSLSENIPDLNKLELQSNISEKNEQDNKDNSRINFIEESSKNENITPVETPQVQKMIQINKASEEEIKSVPGIRLVHAKKIIQLRNHNTYITSFNDFKDKIGIKEEQINQLRKYVHIDKVEKKNNTNHGRILDI